MCVYVLCVVFCVFVCWCFGFFLFVRYFGVFFVCVFFFFWGGGVVSARLLKVRWFICMCITSKFLLSDANNCQLYYIWPAPPPPPPFPVVLGPCVKHNSFTAKTKNSDSRYAVNGNILVLWTCIYKRYSCKLNSTAYKLSNNLGITSNGS